MPRTEAARNAYMQGRADSERGIKRNAGSLIYILGADNFETNYYWYYRGLEEVSP